MRKFLLPFLVVIAIALMVVGYFLFIVKTPQQDVSWGVDFSQMQAETLGLNWKETYLAMLEDLGVKNIKLHTQWDWVEGKRDEFYFKDIDWQVNQAELHDAGIIYVVGMKTGRWPECHLPMWANGLSKEEQQQEVLAYIKKMVTRYKGSKAIVAWQPENEPLFQFGQCPWYDSEFLAKEAALIKSLDPMRPIIISDTGEYSWWGKAASIGDVVGVTMYRSAWIDIFGVFGFYSNYVIPANVYYYKAQLIKMMFGKPVICVELQAEPWLAKAFADASVAEQEKSMNVEKFKANIAFAKRTGLPEVYMWGVEWWYWLKTTQNKPEIWNEAKILFQN